MPAVFALGALVALWSWGSGPNPLIDFGRELYVAWRLAVGDVLYRDIAYFNGPLSAYTNALWFRWLGTSLAVLMACNLALSGVLVLLLHRLLAAVSDRASAAVACAIFVTVFAFANVDDFGNYNYLTPYSHELTHGLLLACAALYAFSWHPRRPLPAALASGAGLGLVALTKIEVCLALGAALALGGALAWPAAGRRRGTALAAAFLAAAAVPPIVALASLAREMPAGDALAGLLTPWRVLIEGRVGDQPFYRWTLGIDEPLKNAGRALRWAGRYVAFAGLVYAVGVWGRARAAGALQPLRGGVLVGLAAFVLATAIGVRWQRALSPLPILLFGLFAVAALGVARARAAGRDDAPLVLRLVLLAFAGLLLLKIALHVRLEHYGFALAMPGTLILVVSFSCWLPRLAGRHGASAPIVRSAVLGTLLAAVTATLVDVADHRRDWPPVGEGPDAIANGGEHAATLDAAVRHIAAVLKPHETLAVLPEGVMLNYLTRRASSTPHINFMPPELLIFGEDAILAAFRAHPPDYVALTHREAEEYGVRFFGRDYGRALDAFVRTHYRPVRLIGDPPLVEGSTFGIALLENRSRVARRTAGREPAAAR